MTQEDIHHLSDDETMADSLISAGEYLIWSIFQEDDFPSIQNLINDGAPLWYQEEESGNSALHAAAHIENVDLVKFLLEKGAVWNAGMGASVLNYFPG
jgi:type IV protein arginine methyltransferase